MHHRRSYGRWRLLLAPPRSGAENMARDTALQARAAKTTETVFSIYSWSRPTLSLGRNQPARDHYDPNRMRDADVDVVRRPTGGRAILHHHEITYSVTAPLDGAGSLRESYARINQILLDGLARLGVVAAQASPTRRAAVPSIRPCFEEPAEGELMAGGGKLVGSAQCRDQHALLQHGSILVDDDQSSLAFFLTGSALENARRIAPATLGAVMGRAPDVSEVAGTMFDAVRALEDCDASELCEDEVRGDALERVPHFLDEGWTWRR